MRKSLLLAIIISLFIGNCNTSLAQTDTEFWFVAPEVSFNHGDEPIILRITTTDESAQVDITMPANPNFPDLSYYLGPNSTISINFTQLGLQNEIENVYAFFDGIFGKNNKGIHIKATNLITAYYEVSSIVNADIFTLKGKNALGKEFYGIFQNVGYNMSGSTWPFPAYSALDIVATEDNTTVTFESTLNQKFYGYGIGTFEVILDRGETLSLVPDWTTNVPLGFPPNCETGRFPSDVFGRSGQDHLSGVKITSDKNIAITKKDDSVGFKCIDAWESQCYDLIGDQLVPTALLGHEYIAIKGYLLDPGEGTFPSKEAPENVYIVAIEDNTEIYLNGNTSPVTIINEGETYIYEFWSEITDISHIRSNNKISVLHVTGFGCEVGGAILPSIDECKGSRNVVITRSESAIESFYLNVIVTAGAEDSFYINNILQDGSPEAIFGPDDFVPVPGTTNWLVLRSEDIPPELIIPTMQTKISNTNGFFHVGIINGGPTSGCKYGYFSNYADNRSTILIGGTSSSNIRICEEETIQLYASGGINYSWTPSDYLSDPNIPFPTAVLPIGIHNYAVTISRPCYSDTTINIEIEVCENPTANFSVNTNSGTSPLTINITNIDTANNYQWYWDDNDLTTPDYETETNLSFTHTYSNSSNTLETKNLTLIVENEFACSDTLIKEITINPETAALPENSYWFVVQEISEDHSDRPVRFVFTTTDSPADITIEMPANPGFTPITISVLANTTEQSIFSTTEQMNSIENRQLIDQLSLPTNEQNNISNKGILITSTAPITAYYEVNATNNSDLWTLKGESGLGEDFYIPFQDIGQNRHINHSERGYSSIDIISIKDNTEIEIFPSNYVFKDGENPSFLNPFTITLDKREVYSLAPAWDATVQHDLLVGWFGVYRDQHLGGTHIHVKNGDKVAVVIKDDSVCEDLTESPSAPRPIENIWGGWDIIADQLVPLKNLGAEYIALRGNLSSDEEYLFVVATEDNTRIWWTSSSVDTTIAAVDIIVQEGEQIRVSFPNTELYKYIISNKKLSILHVTGTGTEMAGAILPSVDNSTGSTKVGFSRSRSDNFHLHLIVKTDAKDGFLINGSSPTFFNESNFTDVPGTQWSVAQIQNISTTNIPVGTATIISNTKGEFHLGLINEIGVSGCRYGYFSDFSSKNPSLQILGYNSTVIQICPDTELQFKATGGTSYSWSPTSYLDDPTSSTPKAILPTGIHTYSVTITRPILGDTTLSAQVEVYENSEALFNVNTTSGCSPLEIEFENLSTEADTFLIDWDSNGIFDTPFDNSMSQTLLHSYINTTDHDTVYTILLKAWHKQMECYDIYEKQIIVHPQISADFSIDHNEGCSPLDINFTNNTTGEDSVLISYGDGTIEVFKSLTSINHIYRNTGANVDTNQIEFIAYNNFGCTDTIRETIIVYPKLKALYTPVLTSISSCDSLIVDFNSSIIDHELASTATYTWDFGDGATSSLADPQHVYKNLSSATPVTRRVDLHVETPLGCSCDTSSFVDVYPLVNANISIDQTTGCSPLTIDAAATEYIGIPTSNYNWTYGDGSASNITDPVAHVYPINPPGANDVYTLTLEVSDMTGSCTDVETKEITVYDEALAEFDPKNSAGCDPYEVSFNNLSLNASTHNWDFDDGGTTSTDFEPTYEFKNTTTVTKNFNVQLEVSSDEGCTNTFISQVNVFPSIEADFEIDISEGCSPLTVTISNNYVGTECYWFWNKDDKIISPEVLATADSIANLANFAKTFVNNSGISRIDSLTLIVGNGNACYKIIKRAITVHSAVDAQFVTNPVFREGCNPLTVDFTNTTINSELNYWDFGDGENSPSNSPSHLFTNSTANDLVFNVSLTTESAHGCTDVMYQPIVVFSNLASDFTIDTKEGCSPLNATILNTSTGNAADTYQWFIDNVLITDSPTNSSNFNYTFDNSGTTIRNYEIKLIATNPHGCTSEKTDSISVYPELVTEIIDSSNVSCNETGNGFISASVLSGIPPYTYMWSTGETNPTITGIDAGIYALTVSDANDCSSVNTVIINEPTQTSVDIESTNVSCYGAADGILAVKPTEGIESFIWSTGATDSIISNLSPGLYAVTVTNNNECISTGSHIILEPDSISIITNSFTESICPSQEGHIEISVYGGIPPYSYTWSSGENSQDIYNLDAGIYNVSVVDMNACFSSKNYIIDSVTSFNDEEICFVSINPELEMYEIVWDRTPDQGIIYYKVYRHNPNTDIYQNVALLPFSDAGYFTDSLANIQNDAFKYKISSINKCATESSLSGFHKSLYLNITNASEMVMLEWEAYEIESGNSDINGYIIYRGSEPTTLNPIDTISSNESNYVDNDPESLINEFYYRIVGIKSSACILSTNNEFNLIYSNLVKNDINTGIETFSDQSINLKIFPNPFNNEVTIEYELFSRSDIIIEVYDIIGKKVSTLKKNKKEIGFHSHLFNPKDYGYTSGIYYIKLIIDNQIISKKIIQIN
ncbi:MAG: T9SS type A sorting domain-containing protein [Bacteroidales bacterium]|nr:T9SS type A sorting domain-containing protein [Bacteroidales bacterium]